MHPIARAALLAALCSACVAEHTSDDPEPTGGQPSGGAGGSAGGAGGDIGGGYVPADPATYPPIMCGADADALQSTVLDVQGLIQWGEGAPPWPAGSTLYARERISGWQTTAEIDAEGQIELAVYPGVYEITVDRCGGERGPCRMGMVLDTAWQPQLGVGQRAVWWVGAQPYQGHIEGGAPLDALPDWAELYAIDSEGGAWRLDRAAFSGGDFSVWLPGALDYTLLWAPDDVLDERLSDTLPTVNVQLGELTVRPEQNQYDLGAVAPLDLTVTLNGEPFPEFTGAGPQPPRGSLFIRRLDDGGEPGQEIYSALVESTGPVHLDLSVPPGRYDVVMQLYALPEMEDPFEFQGYRDHHLCPGGCVAGAPHVRDLAEAEVDLAPNPEDLPRAPRHAVDGLFQIDGDTEGAPLGDLFLVNVEPESLHYQDRYITLEVDAEGRFSGEVPEGRYTAHLNGCSYECAAGAPRGQVDLGEVEISGPETLTFAAEVVDLPIHVTVNGAEMADDPYPQGRDTAHYWESRGTLQLNDYINISFGELGPVDLTVRLLGGEYEAAVVTGELTGRGTTWLRYRQGVLPGGVKRLDPITVAAGGRLDLDLTVLDVALDLDQAANLPGDNTGDGPQVLMLQGDAGDRLWSLPQDDAALSMKVYPGAYRATAYPSGAPFEDSMDLGWITHDSYSVGMPMGEICW